MTWRDVTRGVGNQPDWRWIGVAVIITVGLTSAILNLDPWGLGVPLLIGVGLALVILDIWIRRKWDQRR